MLGPVGGVGLGSVPQVDGFFSTVPRVAKK